MQNRSPVRKPGGRERPAPNAVPAIISLIIVAMTATLVLPTSAAANLIKVESIVDFDPFFCTLRAALLNHNHHDQSGSTLCASGSADDVIELDNARCISGEGERCRYISSVTLDSPLPPIESGTVTIAASPRVASHIFSGYFQVNTGATLRLNSSVYDEIGTFLPFVADRSLFVVEPGAVLELGNGRFTNSASIVNRFPAYGGVIYNDHGTVVLIGSVLFDSQAREAGGAIFNNGGTLTIGSSVFFGATVRERARGEFEPAPGDSAPQGGAIYNDGGVVRGTIDCYKDQARDGSCIFTRNGTVSFDVPTIEGANMSSNTGLRGGRGGALTAENSQVTMVRARFENNGEPDGNGGVIFVDSKSVLNLSSAQCLSNASLAGGCIYGDGAMVNIDKLTCEGNSATDGGCIEMVRGATLTVKNSLIRRNRAAAGGGLMLQNGTSVLILASSIVENRAVGDGTLGKGVGGGVFGLSRIELTVNGSTVGDNDASRSGAGIQLQDFSSLMAINDTFAKQGNDRAPGIYIDRSYIKVLSSTLSASELSVAGVVTGDVRNSILFKSSTCLGNLADQGFNIQYPEPASACANGIPVRDPRLDHVGLRNNGGPTPTIALLPDSPAIDSVPLDQCVDLSGSRLTVDQRGYPRPDPGDLTNRCDTGAFEHQNR